jgi:hypothetical protein
MDLHQIKKNSSSKEIVARIKRHHTEWEKNFASFSTDKGLLSRIHTEPEKLSRRTNIPINKRIE